jgi:hypothetical protein
MKYEWTGETRMIPGVGEPSKGDVIDINEDLGASLAAQGLCKPVASKTVKAAKEETS